MKKRKLYPEEDLPDFLKKLKEENPFMIPFNYFNELPHEIMGRIHEEAKSRRSEPPLQWVKEMLIRLSSSPLAWITSGILILLIAVPFIIRKNMPPSDDFDLEADEIALYIKANIDDFDEDLFYAVDLDQIELFPELEMEEGQLDQMMEDLIQYIDIETLAEIL